MDCWGTTDQRQLMATSAMVDAASAMRNSHIQGLSSVNRIFVSVAKRSQFN